MATLLVEAREGLDLLSDVLERLATPMAAVGEWSTAVDPEYLVMAAGAAGFRATRALDAVEEGHPMETHPEIWSLATEGSELVRQAAGIAIETACDVDMAAEGRRLRLNQAARHVLAALHRVSELEKLSALAGKAVAR